MNVFRRGIAALVPTPVRSHAVSGPQFVQLQPPKV
jgi:hypothetical protein